MLPRTPTARRKNAFSLVELSIVLVILGLLVGGILAGQSLIRASELRAVSTESQRYQTALSAFRDKYFAIAGDFNNASGLGWGSYNGDGDGQVEMTTNASSLTAMNEISGVWIQLASAGLIEGQYTGIAATSTSTATMTAGTNSPRSKMSNGGWNLVYLGGVSSGTPYYNGSYSNALTFNSNYAGNVVTSTGTGPTVSQGVMKAEEAWNVDTKMDDGKPDTGTVFSFKSQDAATTGCANASAYVLGNASTTACSLVTKSGY